MKMGVWVEVGKASDFGLWLILMMFGAMGVIAPSFAQGQKTSTIVIHDSTAAANGGEGATAGFRSAFKSALERDKPCVETMDDQDIRDAIQDERERALLEGGDSDATLKMIAERMGSGLVVSVKSTPGTDGATLFSAFAFDARAAQTVARDLGSDGGKVAENLAKSLGSALSDDCTPHWVGTVQYLYSFNESKQKTDGGAMRVASRNVKRTLTETSIMTTTIKATLLKPDAPKSVNSPLARVSQRIQFTYTKNSRTTGELYCRLPGRNPFYKGFAEDYKEATTQLGQGTDSMQVFIEVEDDGNYTIRVNAPGGTLYGKVETSRNGSGCEETPQPPSNDAQSLPESRFDGTSFEAVGKVDPTNHNTLAGAQTLPDGRTKITWNLRLVKPKGT